MKIMMFIVMFLLIGAFFIIGENKLAIKTEGNFNKFTTAYSVWLGDLFGNVKNVSGYVVKLDWLPKE